MERSSRSVLIRDAASREILARLELRQALPYGAAVSPDGRWLCLALAAAGEGKHETRLQIWDLVARQMTAERSIVGAGFDHVVFASSSACMVSDRIAQDRALLRRFAIPDSTPLGDIETQYADLASTDALAFSPDGAWAIAARKLSNNKTPQVVVFSASDWTPRAWIPARCARFDASGTLLWNPGVDDAAVYDASLQRIGLASRSGPSTCTPRVAAFGNIGVMAQVADGSALLVRAPNATYRWSAPRALSPDGRVAVFVDPAGVFVWTDVPHGQAHRIDVPADEIARDLAFTTDGAQLLVVTDRGILRVFRVEDRSLVSTTELKAPATIENVHHWALHPLRDGRVIVRGNSMTGDFLMAGTPASMGTPVDLKDDMAYFASIPGDGILGVGLYGGLWRLDGSLRPQRKDGLPPGRPRASIGLDLTADGRRAAVYIATGTHEGLHLIETDRLKREARISLGGPILGDARDVRWNRAADAVWISDSAMLAIVVVKTRQVSVTDLWAWGEEADPRPDAGLVVVSPYDDRGLRIVRPDGSVALTFGIHEGGRYAHAPDGRFTCDGNGCNVLRCSLGTRVLPATSPACARLRDPSLDLQTELRRTSAIAPDTRVQLL